jgi:hypothetical protein
MKRVALPLAFATLASCGDPMLPADFTGPPATAVTGNVLPGTTVTVEAAHPRMSLEWLDDINVSLVSQSLSYQRSEKLQADWDIGLNLPKETAKFDRPVGARSVRIGVGKIVYFDDRDGNDQVDWTCRVTRCDRVMAISSQFVVYVERPPYCQSFGGKPAKPRLSAGYHYYSFEGGVLRLLSPSDPMSFSLIDRTPADSDPTVELQSFVQQLLQVWMSNPTTGC